MAKPTFPRIRIALALMAFSLVSMAIGCAGQPSAVKLAYARVLAEELLPVRLSGNANYGSPIAVQ